MEYERDARLKSGTRSWARNRRKAQKRNVGDHSQGGKRNEREGTGVTIDQEETRDQRERRLRQGARQTMERRPKGRREARPDPETP